MLPPDVLWLFDLDNTLHDASAHIFPEINRSMTGYVAEQLGLSKGDADRLRQHYWQRYGATLSGLMLHHGTDPHHFLWHTHQLPELQQMVVFDRGLSATLRRLPGRKIVFSNSPSHYATRVLATLRAGLRFDAIHSIESMKFRPKPGIHAYLRLLRVQRVAPARCILVEDSLDNLRTAKRLGMRTVWISRSPRSPAFVDLRLKSVLELPRELARL